MPRKGGTKEEIMEKVTYNRVNLNLYTAIENIVENELTESRNHFDLVCKDGFYDVIVLVDENGIWSYNAIEIKYDEDEPVFVGITTYEEDGSITYEEMILPRKTFYAARAHALEDRAEYEDLLANW